MKSVPATAETEGKEGGGRCRNKPQERHQQLQLLHLAAQEQWTDAEMVCGSEHMALATSLPHKVALSFSGTRPARQKRVCVQGCGRSQTHPPQQRFMRSLLVFWEISTSPHKASGSFGFQWLSPPFCGIYLMASPPLSKQSTPAACTKPFCTDPGGSNICSPAGNKSSVDGEESRQVKLY